MCLHPIHTILNGALIQFEHEPTGHHHCTRVESRIQFVQQRLQEFAGPVREIQAPPETRAHLMSSELQLFRYPLQTTSKSVGRVSLLFCDAIPVVLVRDKLVRWSEDFPVEVCSQADLCIIIASARRNRDTKVKLSSDIFPIYEPSSLWLFRVPRGCKDLRRLRNELAVRGCIQAGLCHIWNIEGQFLGEGGFSVVFAGSSRQSNENFPDVAVKLLSRKNDMRNVRDEVKCLIACKGHPNILQFCGIFVTLEQEKDQLEEEIIRHANRRWDGLAQYALAFELIELGDMWQLLSKMGKFPKANLLCMMHGVLAALAFMHERRIIHRDVKCANVMIRSDGEAVLADFGLALSLAPGEVIRQWSGSAGWAAPEQVPSASGKCKYGLEVDVFGAGVCLYWGLTRRLPFSASSKLDTLAATRTCKPNFDLEALQSATADTRQLLQHLMAKRPADRPSAAEALELVGALCRGDEEVTDAEFARFAASRRPGLAWRMASSAAAASGSLAASAFLGTSSLAGALVSRARLSKKVAPAPFTSVAPADLHSPQTCRRNQLDPDSSGFVVPPPPRILCAYSVPPESESEYCAPGSPSVGRGGMVGHKQS
ncbi:unnamed protein product [Polarella glacialis]|uniref:Protein kinase domain-containing protein n=1 Tax=Polarella glacialis TaxID=89957 RepID=A0A813J097_POLGL|nr:unnamed protein product [Polarella glacialis]